MLHFLLPETETMIDGRITALLLVSNREEANLIKQQVLRSATSAVTLTAYSVDEFIKKLTWFPTTFILVNEKSEVETIKAILQKTYGQNMPLIITSTANGDLSGLPLQLKIAYDKTASFRASQESRRLQSLNLQKKGNQK